MSTVRMRLRFDELYPVCIPDDDGHGELYELPLGLCVELVEATRRFQVAQEAVRTHLHDTWQWRP